MRQAPSHAFSTFPHNSAHLSSTIKISICPDISYSPLEQQLEQRETSRSNTHTPCNRALTLDCRYIIPISGRPGHVTCGTWEPKQHSTWLASNDKNARLNTGWHLRHQAVLAEWLRHTCSSNVFRVKSSAKLITLLYLQAQSLLRAAMEAINLEELPLSPGASTDYNSYTTVIQLLVSQNRSYYFGLLWCTVSFLHFCSNQFSCLDINWATWGTEINPEISPVSSPDSIKSKTKRNPHTRSHRMYIPRQEFSQLAKANTKK